MKLHYFVDPKGNFGDDLNPWLWPRVAPGLLDDDASELFVGIGTLINHRLPESPLKHVMGSGVGYGRLPVVDDRIRFHAVRGPHSARVLGLPDDVAITDAAVLLRALDWTPAPSDRPKVNLVLTGESQSNFDWEPVCREAGIGMISCHEDVEAVLSAIRGSDLVLADAMHGAIAADTLRVPWVAVTCNEDILAAKWKDWLASLKLPYEPVHIEPLFEAGRGLGSADRLKRLAKIALARVGAYEPASHAMRRNSTASQVERAAAQLAQAARNRPQLSDSALLDRCVDRFIVCIDRLRRERAAGARR